MRFLKKHPIARYLILALLAIIIGGNIFALNASRLAGNQVPMPFGYGASVVLSGSMEPTLSIGDLLILQEADAYYEGDIVVYQSGKMAVVHRIVSIGPEAAITRGDANNANDEPIPLTAIKGKVIRSVPKVGHLVWAIKSPLGLIVTVALAVLLVEFSYRDEKKTKNDEQEQLKAEIRKLMEELEEEGKSLMTFVKETYHYRQDRVSRALADMTDMDDAMED